MAKKSNALPDSLQAKVEFHLSKSREIRAISEGMRKAFNHACELVTNIPTPTPRPKRKR
jgi:hypothetical protein